MSCATQEPFYNASEGSWQEAAPDSSSDLLYEVYLIGNSRKAFENKSLVELLSSRLSMAGENSSVVFLGDNVRPGIWADSTRRKWELAKQSMDVHKDILKKFKGNIFFLPGYHDWDKGGRDGLETVKSQRKYIEKSLDKKKIFLPKKGRPGPEEIHLTDDIVLIIFDSHWWFQEHEKSYSGIDDEADLFIQIEDAVSRNRDKKIIFAAGIKRYTCNICSKST